MPSSPDNTARDRLISRARKIARELTDTLSPHARRPILPPPTRATVVKKVGNLSPIIKAIDDAKLQRHHAALKKHLEDNPRGQKPGACAELARALHETAADIPLSSEGPNRLSFGILQEDVESALDDTFSIPTSDAKPPPKPSLSSLTRDGEEKKPRKKPAFSTRPEKKKPSLSKRPERKPAAKKPAAKKPSLEALTRSGEQRAVKRKPFAPPPSSRKKSSKTPRGPLESPPLPALSSDPIEADHTGLFDAFDHPDEDLSQPAPTPVRSDSASLLPSSDTSFEDSGLFQIFVDETFEAADESENPELADDFEFEIDVEPLQRLTDAEAAYLGFVDHLNRILRELFDNLELGLIRARYDALIQVARNLNRLARLLDFVYFDAHLPLISYLHSLLPVSFKPRPTGVFNTPPEREVLPESIPSFKLKINELLSCLVILIGELVREVPGLDRDRFERSFLEFYETLELVPTEPSRAAPINLTGEQQESYSQLKLASIARLASDAETRVTKVLACIEDALFHGQTDGYYRASRHLLALGDALSEQQLSELLRPLIPLASLLRRLQPPAKPASAMMNLLTTLISNLGESLPRFNHKALLTHARKLESSLQFDRRKTTEVARIDLDAPIPEAEDAPDWSGFRNAAAPDLKALLSTQDTQNTLVRSALLRLRDRARDHQLTTLAQLFEKLLGRFDRAPHDLHDLEELLASLRALPPENIPAQHVEELAKAFLEDAARTAVFDARRREPYSDPRAKVLFELIATIDDFSKKLDLAIAKAEIERLAGHAEELHALAAEARERKLHALALATEVIATLFRHPTADAQRARLHRAAIEANDRLSHLLNNAAHDLDPINPTASTLATIDTFFLPDTHGSRDANTLVERNVLKHARPLLEELRSHARKSTDAEALARLLEDITQLASYLAHDSASEHARGLLADLSQGALSPLVLKPRLNQLLKLLQKRIPDPPRPPQHPTIEAFCQQAFVWTRRVFKEVDTTSSDAARWSPLLRDAASALAPLARESLQVPIIATTCELQTLVQEMTTVTDLDIIRPRFEQALYWLDQILWLYSHGIATRSASADETPPETDALVECSLRIDAAHLAATLSASHSLQEHLDPILALAEQGPFKLASAQGRKLFDGLDEPVRALSHALKLLVPDSLDAQLGRITGRLTTRASVQGKSGDIHYEVDPELTGTVTTLAPLFAAAETLAEAIIDNALSPQRPTRLTLHLRADDDQGTRLTLEHNGTPITREALTTALAAAGLSPHEDTPTRELIRTLVEHPAALLRLSEGPALALAVATLKTADASIDIEHEPHAACVHLIFPSA